MHLTSDLTCHNSSKYISDLSALHKYNIISLLCVFIGYDFHFSFRVARAGPRIVQNSNVPSSSSSVWCLWTKIPLEWFLTAVWFGCKTAKGRLFKFIYMTEKHEAVLRLVCEPFLLCADLAAHYSSPSMWKLLTASVQNLYLPSVHQGRRNRAGRGGGEKTAVAIGATCTDFLVWLEVKVSPAISWQGRHLTCGTSAPLCQFGI